jgi:hypothetical protein
MPIDFDDSRWDQIKEDCQRWWAGELKRPLIQMRLTGRDPGRPPPAHPDHHRTAFMGADAFAAPEQRTVWFEPATPAEITDIHFEHDPHQVWLDRIKDVSRAAIERWQGAVQVCMTDRATPLMRPISPSSRTTFCSVISAT